MSYKEENSKLRITLHIFCVTWYLLRIYGKISDGIKEMLIHISVPQISSASFLNYDKYENTFFLIDAET